MTAVRHLTIVGRRRADLALPATIALAQLMPRLVQLVEDGASGPGAVYLARPTGERLVAERSLTELGIEDGELLVLHGEEEAATPPVIDDWVGAVRRSTEAGAGRWTASMGRDLTLAAAAAGIAAAGGWAALSHAPVVALGLALGLLMVAACLDRIPGIGWPAIAWAALALPLAGAAAGGLVPRTMAADGAWAVGLRTVAVGVAGVAAALATPSLSAPFVAAALAALPVGAAALLVGSGHGTPVQGAAVLSVFWALLVWRLPGLVVVLLGWRRPSTANELVGLEAVGRRIAWGRSLLAWLMTGAGVGLLVSLVVLSRGAGVFPPLLVVALGLAMLLRARHHHFVGEVAPLLLLALAALALLEVRLVAPHHLALSIAVALGSAVAVAIIGWLARFALGSVFVRRGLEYLELVANAALVPLAVGALGLYTVASQLGHHLG